MVRCSTTTRRCGRHRPRHERDRRRRHRQSRRVDQLRPARPVRRARAHGARDRHIHLHGVDVADPVTVFVTVTGVDDVLVIGGVGSTALAYNTGSDALAVSPVAHAVGRRQPHALGRDGSRRRRVRARRRRVGGRCDAWDGAAGTLRSRGRPRSRSTRRRSGRSRSAPPALTPSGARTIEVSAGGGVATRAVDVTTSISHPRHRGHVRRRHREHRALVVDASVLDNDDDADDERSALSPPRPRRRRAVRRSQWMPTARSPTCRRSGSPATTASRTWSTTATAARPPAR